MRLLDGLLLPFMSSEAAREELLFIDTVDRLLAGEAVKDLSGDDIVVAVELAELAFFTLLKIGMPEFLRTVGVDIVT